MFGNAHGKDTKSSLTYFYPTPYTYTNFGKITQNSYSNAYSEHVFNRPCVSGTVLQSPPSFINLLN